MTHDYKETLYNNLFNVLSELTEHESPEVIFDHIVENFAMSAEYHMGQADTFKSMLDAFRHDNPVETVSDLSITPPSENVDVWSRMSDINRQYMLEDRDQLMDFLSSAKNLTDFPDTI